jgi:hypothetical protein
MPRRAGTGNNGKLQATILKKCDRTYHRPETNKEAARRIPGQADQDAGREPLPDGGCAPAGYRYDPGAL